MVDLRRRTGILSLDADYFLESAEHSLVPDIDRLIRDRAARTSTCFRDYHVDLTELITEPVDYVINFDSHMDCSLEFLFGAPPRDPPVNATVFEGLLARGLVRRYIWACPDSRRSLAAKVYASATVAGRQPRLSDIHCVTGRFAVAELLDHADLALIFACRSPDYATAATDAIYDGWRASVAT